MHQRSFEEAVHRLSKVSAQAAPKAVLDAIAGCVPIAGGTIGTMLVRGSIQSLKSHAADLPSDTFESWMSTPQRSFARMMAPLVRGRVGGLFTERREITGPFREELDVVRCVHATGFGETAGYKVGSRQTASGDEEIVFMTLALDGGATFGPEHHEVLAALQPAIKAAVERLHVPLLSSQSMLEQILDEQTIGYACLSDEGRIVEANERAYALVHRYTHAMRAAVGLSTLKDLAARLRGTKAGHPLCFGDRAGLLEVSAHRLAKETHAIPEDLTLVVMKEWTITVHQAGLPLENLTERQREIAVLLATTALQYKEIADRLDIEQGTMRKHVEQVYRRLGVQSREELMLRWRKPGSS